MAPFVLHPVLFLVWLTYVNKEVTWKPEVRALGSLSAQLWETRVIGQGFGLLRAKSSCKLGTSDWFWFFKLWVWTP